MADYKPTTFPFTNRGMVLKVDPAELKLGEFQYLQNMNSLQEGALTVRQGTQRKISAVGVPSAYLGHTIAKLRKGGLIYGTVNTSGTAVTWVSGPKFPSWIALSVGIITTGIILINGVYYNIISWNSPTSLTIAASAGSQSGVPFTASMDARYGGFGQLIQRGSGLDTGSMGVIQDLGTKANPVRWTSEDYATGISGNASKYFATNTMMLKDDATNAAALQWGIFPPTRPVVAKLDSANVVSMVSGDFTNSTLTGTGITPTTGDRLSGKTVASATGGSLTPTSVGPSAGELLSATVSPSMTAVIPGELVHVGSEFVPVESVTTTAFAAYFTASHVAGTSISSIYEILTLGAAGTFNASSGPIGPIDLSLSGLAADAYDSPDPVHVSILLNDPTLFTDVHLQLDVSDTGGTFLDYYDTVVSVDASNVNSWNELDIIKTAFTKVGRAGTGANYSWKAIKAWRLVFTTSGAASVQVGSLYGMGGKFPTVDPANIQFPYKYLYTYRNDVSQLEGNPCQPMISTNWVEPNRQFVRLTLYGTDDAQISQTAGHRSIAIYRTGGSFSDGIYRKIGYATNPGVDLSNVPKPVVFIDNVPDANITSADVVEYDNDPPVSSNLQIPLAATIGSSSVPGGGLTTLTLTIQTPSGLTDLSTILPAGQNSPVTVGRGTPLTIGPGNTGDNQETVLIETWNPGSGGNLTVSVYCQYAHATGESVAASYVVGQPCNLCCQAFGSFFLAGDINNPHLLYKAKTTRPEAWPIVNLENGASGSVAVGSPSNPIMALTEYGGQVLVMNLATLSVVSVWQGVMQAPVETPAKRGLLASFAWCKVGNEIWYLSYDGIYSWAGGQERKRSEAVNPLFMGQTVNGVAPIDMTPGLTGGLQDITMAYHNHEVNVIFKDINGSIRRLRYSLIYDRWYLVDDGEAPGDAGPFAVYAMHVDEDSGNLVLGKYINNVPATYLEYDDVGSSDSWHAVGTDGSPINFTAFTEFYNLGAPAENKHYGDLVLELDNTNCTSLTVSVYWDFSSSADANNTFTIPTVSGRRTVALPIVDGGGLAVGHDARAMAIKITGSSAYPLTLYSLTFNSLPLELKQRGRAYDWDSLGHPYDKKLEQLIIEYDMGQAGGNTVTLCMDTLSGIAGITETNSVQTFTLTGTGRCSANFPINADTVVKMIRLRPISLAGQANSFMIWKYDFQKINYPADSTYFTDWEDCGTEYDKYFQQIMFDVDTGGVGATVIVQIDGVSVQTLPVFSTTAGARNIPFTLNPNLKGKKARLLITPGGGGKFQLFANNFIFHPADRGKFYQIFDLYDLGLPFYKWLKTVTFEYDTGGNVTTVNMDTLTGIKGSTQTSNVQSFVLDGAARSKETFPINDGIVVKMVKLYPASDNTVFKEWKYQFDKVDYPADTIYFTEATDLGYQCEKILRELSIEIDTGGVACSIGIEIDGTVQNTFSVTTTLNDKARLITLPSRPNELIGKLFRLKLTPGVGGKAQLFNHKFSRIIEPCYLTHVSTFEQNYGSNGYKLLKQAWFEYICAGQIVVSIYTDARQLFYQKTLPAHVGRDVERFYLPAVSNGVLNKSKVYAVDVDSVDITKPFKLYRDSNRLEIKNMNEQQRAGFLQKYVWQVMPIDSGGA